MPEILYVLFDKNNPYLKIGISTSPNRRRIELRREIDLERSFVLKSKELTARELEKILHSLFSRSRRPQFGDKDGYTEWFEVGIETELHTFLSSNHDVLGGISVQPLKDLDPQTSTSERTLSPEEKEAQRKDKNLNSCSLAIVEEILQLIEPGALITRAKQFESGDHCLELRVAEPTTLLCDLLELNMRWPLVVRKTTRRSYVEFINEADIR